ncbi:excitatory amino acid transporter isoform X1 [Hydra vulgaris]|uniref:excitatory amino acid transporter isoform X1 n=1 Tax=Hydra vulgaris TaxID=6087 RepID=UPI000640F1D5|nr:excitatory amino acid transporter [Hydra vulgaris]
MNLFAGCKVFVPNWLKKKRRKLVTFLKKNLLVVLIVFGAFLGIIIGISINTSIQKIKQPNRYTAITCIGFPGELLIRMLKMLILPLIVCSLIAGLSNIDTKTSLKVGGRALTYYLSTTALAAILGLILVSAIKPGKGIKQVATLNNQELVNPLDSFLDIVRNMFPANIISACFEQDKTIIVEIKEAVETKTILFTKGNLTNDEINELIQRREIYLVSSGNKSETYMKNETIYRNYKIGKGLGAKGPTNFLGLIIFSIAVGTVACKLGEKAKPFVDIIVAFNDIVTELLKVVMWYSPFGIGCLIIASFSEMENVSKTLSSLGLFITTVVLGIAIHGFVVLPGLYFAFTRKNPYIFLKGMFSAMATAFGTSSSAATLPVTFQCLEEKLNIDKRITRFIIPIGTTVNMDGTALYEAVSAIFIAQSIGRQLSFGDYILISLTSILASIGAAAIPHAGLITMIIVLDTVGLPTDMVAVFFSVDWFLGRIRTMINVLGDAYGAGIVQHLSKNELENITSVHNAAQMFHESFSNSFSEDDEENECKSNFSNGKLVIKTDHENMFSEESYEINSKRMQTYL